VARTRKLSRKQRVGTASRRRKHQTQSIGGYLIERMLALGVNDVFGIPGDFVLGFYGMLERSPIRIVGTCNELNAGYAADAYARVNGVGAVCVTYSVGGFSLINAVAGAYAEKSAVIVIGAAPVVGVYAGKVMPPPTGAVNTPRFEYVSVFAPPTAVPST